MKRFLWLILVLVSTLVFSTLAFGQDAPADTTADMARVRVAHLSPNAPIIDIGLTSTLEGGESLTPDTLQGLSYETVTDYLEVPPGEYTVTVFSDGAVVMEDVYVLGPGFAYTLAALGLVLPEDDAAEEDESGFFGFIRDLFDGDADRDALALRLLLLEDTTLISFVGDESFVRVIHAAPGTDAIELTALADGEREVLSGDLSFGGVSNYINVLKENEPSLRIANSDALTLELSDVALEPETVTTLFFVGTSLEQAPLKLAQAVTPLQTVASPDTSPGVAAETAETADQADEVEEEVEGEVGEAESEEGNTEGEAADEEAEQADEETNEAANESANESTEGDAEGKTIVRMLLGGTGSTELHQEVADMFMEENPDIQIELLDGPQTTDELLSVYLQFFETESNEVDVLQTDVTWPGFMSEFLLDLNEYGAQDVVSEHLPKLVDNNTIDDQLLAVPWFTDVGILYYRTDLLEKYGYDAPPTTWDELEEMAATIQEGERQEEEGSDFWGFIFQGRPYEGLTVDALEWIASHGGGTLLDAEGNVTLNNENAVAALERAKGWIDTISPPAVNDYAEEDTRNTWQAGRAAFMRNWPYAFPLSNGEGSMIEGLVGVTALPAGPEGESSGVLGGWGLAVSKFSDNPEAAAKVALFFASPEVQRMRSIEASFTPTVVSLFSDAEVVEANPFYDFLQGALENAVARPGKAAGQAYFDLSQAFYSAVYDILVEEDIDTAESLEALELDFQDILEERNEQ